MIDAIEYFAKWRKVTQARLFEMTLVRWVGRKSLLVVDCNYVSRTVSEIFCVKLWRDFEILVKGGSRSLKIAPFYRPYTTYL